jgi:non-ribosomal peptide synthase protein (TIGR01720 family)
LKEGAKMKNAQVLENYNGSEIAIIGMALRFPGAKSVDQFWENLRDGRESISFFSNKELETAGVSTTDISNPNYVKAYGRLADVDLFDAAFFGYTPREAELSDPQHRLFLECAWEALENAGYDSDKYNRPIGVYAGSGGSMYWLNFFANPDVRLTLDPFMAAVANDKDFLTSRTSYKMNLTGPSVAVQTACSTSLVAIHQACQALLSGACDLALAGGATIRVQQTEGYIYQEGGIYSPDGHCRAFDAKAKGTISGSGVGVVALKRLEDALLDGDHIEAVIKGSAINNDGAFKVGYTAPSVEGQAKVIRMAQIVAEVNPETITYIEAHGTGTELGDPIEIAALNQAFRSQTQKRSFCAIGSVKSNIGHLDTAAGIAGLIKVILALKYKKIPPSLHFEQPNPQIDFDDSPFYVNSRLSNWPKGQTPRRAGVSSFGIGGTNAHAIVEEAPELEASDPARPWHLLLLSAKTARALETATLNLVEHLKAHREENFADIAYTLQVGRKAFGHRRALVCRDIDDAVNAMQMANKRRVHTENCVSQDRPVAFMFSGQGSQYVNMGLELFKNEPVFRDTVNTCIAFLKPHIEFDLLKILYPSGNTEQAQGLLGQTIVTQPSLFVIEYALAKLWMERGIVPQAMIGHSIGEYVGACLAGVFELEDALALVAARGRLMQTLATGAMLAVPLSDSELRPFINSHISIAAINGPSNCVVSGPEEDINALETALSAKDIDSKRLHTSHAFHSKMMEPILNEFAEMVRKIKLQAPALRFVSNVTGTWITTEEATSPYYWARHIRETVRFSQGVRELLREPGLILLEVGPGDALRTLARRQVNKNSNHLVLSSLRHSSEQKSDVALLLETLGTLWLSGVNVQWHRLYSNERRRRVALPTYPFEHQRYWVDPQVQFSGDSKVKPPFREKPDPADWFYVPSWKRSIPSSALLVKSANEFRRWLIFNDQLGLGSRLIERLKQNGQEVVCVGAGKKFALVDEHNFTINPHRKSEYDALFVELKASKKMPHSILHLWNVTANDGMTIYDQALGHSFYSLIYLAQALGEHNGSEAIQINIISNKLYFVTGEETIDPTKGLLLGPTHVIPQEYPNISCRNIDISSQLLTPGTNQQLIDKILSEVSNPSEESIVAYRGNSRWVQNYEPVRLEIENTQSKPARLREGGVYLITGGLGGIGLSIAEYFAESVVAKLVLIGRSFFPEREEWDLWLSNHDQSNDISLKIRKIRALESLGAQVLVFTCNAADFDQMRGVMDLVKARFGEVNGIVHAAGVAGAGVIHLKKPEDASGVLASKVQGALVLDALANRGKLDFFILCSSLRSMVGGIGQVDYSAANAFLDCFANSKATDCKTLTTSINWDSWQQVGMSVNAARSQDIAFEEVTRYGLSPREGLTALTYILSAGLPQVIVTRRRLEDSDEYDCAPGSSNPQAQPQLMERSRSAYLRPQLSSVYERPRNEVERILVEIWQDLLRIDHIGINDNFVELGGDSVVSIQIIARARQAGLRLTPRQMFEYQTIAELSAFINLSDEVELEQKLVIGRIPLTPIQSYFFEQCQIDIHHFNQSVVLQSKERIDLSLLKETVNQLLIHHDGLRLRFIEGEKGWEQHNDGIDNDVPVSALDLSGLPSHQQTAAIEAAATQAQSSLSLSKGPTLRIVLFELGGGKPSRVLIVIHHLMIDAISWRILLEDLESGYEQLKRSGKLKLPLKTTSFKRWAERLKLYAQSGELKEELQYWIADDRAGIKPLPVDFAGGRNTEGSARHWSCSLDEDDTRALLYELSDSSRLQINEVVLAALAMAYERWTGHGKLLINIEGHGREELFQDEDVTRTIGWFTAVYPLLLEIRKGATVTDIIRYIKQKVNKVPKSGIGHGLLLHLCDNAEIREKLRSLPRPQISFLYLGQFNRKIDGKSRFEITGESFGPAISQRQLRHHLLDLSCYIADGRFQLRLTYSENVHQYRAIERFAEYLIDFLRSIITCLRADNSLDYRSSDFPGASVEEQELDDIISQLDEIDV